MSRPLETAILIYLWVALVEDSVLFIMSWFAPQLGFNFFITPQPLLFSRPLSFAALADSG